MTGDGAGDETPRIPPAALRGLETWQTQVVWANGLEVVTWRLHAAHGCVGRLAHPACSRAFAHSASSSGEAES